MDHVSRSTKCLFLGFLISSLICIFSITANAEELVAPWEPWKPYSYIDTSGNLVGLDVEMMRAIVKNMDNNGERYTLEYIKMHWARVLYSLNIGERIHFAAGGAITPKRAKIMNFSEPYRAETYAIYILKKDLAKFSGVKVWTDIIPMKFRLGTVRGYNYGDSFKKVLESDKKFAKRIQMVVSDQLNIKKLLAGRIEGFIGQTIVTPLEMKKNKLKDKIVKLVIVESFDVVVMFSKKSVSKDVIRSFNKSLRQVKSNGTIDKIMKKYVD